MNKMHTLYGVRTLMVLAVAICLLGSGCATYRLPGAMIADAPQVPADGKIEIAVTSAGHLMEIELHLAADQLPDVIVEAAHREMPGGTIVDAEKEYDGGTYYYEVTKNVNGMEMEVMFTLAGELHAMEVPIRANETPAAVLETAEVAVPGGTRVSIEKILNADRTITEYHIKKAVSGLRYKIIIMPDGKLVRAMREVPAEIEIPVKTG
jgi:hypothetical protein